MKPMDGGVYHIRNNVTGQVYVGQTKKFSKRKVTHWRELRNGKHANGHLQSAWNKYGEDAFSFVHHYPCLSDEDRDMAEQLLLDLGCGDYNLVLAVGQPPCTKGMAPPNKGKRMSEEQKLKLAQSWTPERRVAMAAMVRSWITLESIAKMAETKRREGQPTGFREWNESSEGRAKLDERNRETGRLRRVHKALHFGMV